MPSDPLHYTGKKLRIPMPLEQFQEFVEAGEYQAHKFSNGAAITEIVQHPQERVLVVHFIAGEGFSGWMDEAQKKLDDFAKANGCVAIEAICRIGLARKIEKLGWKTFRKIMRRNI